LGSDWALSCRNKAGRSEEGASTRLQEALLQKQLVEKGYLEVRADWYVKGEQWVSNTWSSAKTH
jgi:hypothetical protein